MRVRWLRAALRNLDEEATFIAQEDPTAARNVVHRVLEAVTLLAAQPNCGRPGRILGTRELLVPKTRYIIPYRVVADEVIILRVFHASRKPPASW